MKADGKITGSLSGVETIKGDVLGTGNVKGGMSTSIAWDYEKLKNLPSIEGHTLIGDKTFPELGMNTLTTQEIETILYLN